MSVGYKQCAVSSATIVGVEAVPVTVEVVVSNGMPGFSIVGMTDVAIQEARERVRAALKGCGFKMPGEKIVVNLAPGYLKKSGSGFDLPIAAGLLVATKQVPSTFINDSIMVGELSLEGKVKPVRGMLAYQELARTCNKALICGPTGEYVSDETKHCVKVAQSLQDLRSLHFEKPLDDDYCAHEIESLDFKDVGGHEQVKRALQIAAAGNHGLLMMGPPGSGKTMLASRLPSILPPLDEKEKLESAKIYSIAGEDPSSVLMGVRPFRAPHHSATAAGLLGGGKPIRPGELSLAHNGIAFLDEIAEFRPSVLQVLRKPLEDGRIVLTRADGNVEMPARFMLVAASNPCPCGYYGNSSHECTCSASQIVNYQNRIGGPLIDRMDMCMDVWRSNFDDVVRSSGDIDSNYLRDGVLRARAFAQERANYYCCDPNPRSTKEAVEVCHMDVDTKKFLESMAMAHAMSGRAICSTLRVARTIADIEERNCVTQEHVAEALLLRLRSRE